LNNFYQRLFTGIGYITLMAGSLIAGGFYAGILFLLIVNLALMEFYNLVSAAKHQVLRLSGLAAGSLIYVISFLHFSGYIPSASYFFIIPVMLGLFILEIYQTREYQLASLALLVIGILYIVVPLSLANGLMFPDKNNGTYTPGILLGLFSLTWMNDTGAYVAGMLFGKHRLFERLSPKKSWEGFAGGTLLTLILAYWMDTFTAALTRTDWLVIGMLVSVLGVYGDLYESWLKRAAGVKDSGKLLPGHGGILDRFDSVLFIIPGVFFYLALKDAFH
jgi:phosphatidate cytidylyltransferase